MKPGDKLRCIKSDICGSVELVVGKIYTFKRFNAFTNLLICVSELHEASSFNVKCFQPIKGNKDTRSYIVYEPKNKPKGML